MSRFRQGWAVLSHDTGWDDDSETQKSVVDVLRVYFERRDALAEVYRLRALDADPSRLYYMEQTEVERPAKSRVSLNRFAEPS